MKKLFFIVCLLIPLWNRAQQVTPEAEQRARELVRQMTLEEKISYISGINGFDIRPIPRLGIPTIHMADGPQGVRTPQKSTMYPCGIAAASTWNRPLIHQLGSGMGDDCRARGIHILLAPGTNLYRSPLCGRNFEYYGEDPYLAGETAKAFIEGIQSREVIATIKHFAANNQEWDRYNVSSDVDERTLHELYLSPFRKAVLEAHTGAVMNSYNLLNGVHTTENPYLNIDILRNRWKFKGILMSDWGSVHSCVNAMNGGLDLEMPGAAFFKEASIKEALQNGTITEETLDLKVQHILQTLIAFHFFDRDQKISTLPLQNPANDQIALEVAREGMVLLKNEDHILPLKGRKRVLILGPNADVTAQGGGSGYSHPFHTVSMLQGLRSLKNSRLQIDTLPAVTFIRDFSVSNEFYTDTTFRHKGFKAEYFKNEHCSGKPALERTETILTHHWGEEAPFKDFPADHFSVRFSAIYKPQKSVNITFKGSGDDGYRLYINDQPVFSDWSPHAISSRQKTISVEAGKTYRIRYEYFDEEVLASVSLSYSVEDEKILNNRLAKADAVILCVGFNSQSEKEGADRSFRLPEDQTELIRKISSRHPRVIVVVNAGGGTNFYEWQDKVKGILMAWYPGQEGGRAIAEILSGRLSPSGKLPITIEKQWEDNPAARHYHDHRNTGHKRICYAEGIFSGYRGYERNRTEVCYPFGFGLSYTSFAYSDLKVNKQANNQVEIRFKIKNTGKQAASEIAQVYVGDPQCSVVRPVKELKGYEKVFLKPGETKEITVLLNEEAFAFYDIRQHRFITEPGAFEIQVGASSRDIRLKGEIEL